MKDAKYIALFVVLGLILAYVTSAPYRRHATGVHIGAVLPQAGVAEGTVGDERVYAHGTVNVAVSLPSDVAHRVLFLILKTPFSDTPIAMKRTESPTFPFTFVLTASNNVEGAEFVEGDLILTARLDADGVAGPKQPDDVDVTVPIPAASDRRVSVTLTN